MSSKKTKVELKCNSSLVYPEDAKFIIKDDNEMYGVVSQIIIFDTK